MKPIWQACSFQMRCSQNLWKSYHHYFHACDEWWYIRVYIYTFICAQMFRYLYVHRYLITQVSQEASGQVWMIWLVSVNIHTYIEWLVGTSNHIMKQELFIFICLVHTYIVTSIYVHLKSFICYSMRFNCFNVWETLIPPNRGGQEVVQICGFQNEDPQQTRAYLLNRWTLFFGGDGILLKHTKIWTGGKKSGTHLPYQRCFSGGSVMTKRVHAEAFFTFSSRINSAGEFLERHVSPFQLNFSPPQKNMVSTPAWFPTPPALACYHALFVLTARESSVPRGTAESTGLRDGQWWWSTGRGVLIPEMDFFGVRNRSMKWWKIIFW